MLSFEMPWAFALLPIPYLIYLLYPAAKQQQAAVRVPFFSQWSDIPGQTATSATRSTIRLLLMSLIWLLLIIAAASPKWVGEIINIPSSGRDLLLAVDLSLSMNEQDMVIQGERASRLIATKVVLDDFIERRKGDRLGLILFGDQAYVQAPLTFDTETVKQFLIEAQIGFAGRSTAIGDAIGLAVKRLRDRPGERHVVILLTDGQNTAGEVQPIPAAKLAAEESITIYTVGIGADEMIVPGILGTDFGSRVVNPSKDLDEQTLTDIAKLTGGQYFRARNPEELLQIYSYLDELEPIEDKKQSFRPIIKLFYWPLGTALLLSGLFALGNINITSQLNVLRDDNIGDRS